MSQRDMNNMVALQIPWHHVTNKYKSHSVLIHKITHWYESHGTATNTSYMSHRDICTILLLDANGISTLSCHRHTHNGTEPKVLSQLDFFPSQFEFCHGLSFVTTWVLSQHEFCQNLNFVAIYVFSFVTIWFFSFVTISVFEFCHNLSFWVMSPFEFLSFITIWVIEFCHHLSFWVSS